VTTRLLLPAVFFVIAGVVTWVVALRCADGRIKRNRIAGIRTKYTRESEESWLTAHRAALPDSIKGSRAFVLGGLALPVARVGVILAMAGLAVGMFFTLKGARSAVRAVTPMAERTPKKK
jgi:SdpI/YfhL protein family